jgi:PAS domain S-box-containing protein
MAYQLAEILSSSNLTFAGATDVENANSLTGLQHQNALILQAIGEGVYGLDREGKATFVNPAAEAMTGWKSGELIGKTIHDFHHHRHEDGSLYHHHDCPIYHSIKDGRVHHVDNEVFWRKNGTSFAVEYTSTPIFDQHQLVGAVIVFKDITERKASDRALHKALSQVQRLKERLQAENTYLQEEIKAVHNFTEIIGDSPSLLKVLQQVEQVAVTEASVLILGESGTGKELIARAIHDRSPRKNRPLVKVNCGAIVPGLVESELFGHEKGAFTGAIQQRIGRFELADGGTIFLDEVAELPLDVQVKLLRVLQEREIERVGSNKPIKVDVRIIAATHRDLGQMVQDKSFRMDLFYRLNVFPLQVPPLRERRGDISLLCHHMLNKLNAKLGKHIQGLSVKAMSTLLNYAWPGNIRELFNVLERAAIVSNNVVIELADHLGVAPQATETTMEITTMAIAERQHIVFVLNKVGWTIAGKGGAAELLALPPSTLRSRMKKLGIDKRKYDNC